LDGDRTEALYWDGSRYVLIGGLGSVNTSFAAAMSGNGTTIVGGSINDNAEIRAFRWTEAAGMVDLGTVRSDNSGLSFAHDVSHNGDVIVGQTETDASGRVGFYWTAWDEAMRTLLGIQGNADDGSSALAVSRSGTLAAGVTTYDDVTTATWWNIASGDDRIVGTELSGLGGDTSAALALDYWGHKIVGYAHNEDQRERAVRWTSGAGGSFDVEDLGVLDAGYSSRALSISADGNVIGGYSEDVDGRYLAFRWQDGEMVYLGDWLLGHGVDIGSLRLADLKALSEDGSVMAGSMEDEDGDWRAYIARTRSATDPGPNPGSGNGIMDVAEYHSSLYGAASIVNAGEFLTWLPMNGAHHRPLMLTPNLSGDMCAWATGDFAHHGDSGANIALAEAGACVDLAGGSVRMGAAVGTSRTWQSLSRGGAFNMAGQYVLGEIDWQPDGTPLLLSATGMLGSWQANIDRAYSNGAATAFSSGQTNGTGGVVRVRADWLEAAKIGSTSVNPWASVSFGALHVNGYRETGGPFPARFEAQNLQHGEVRLGLTAVTELSTQTKLSTSFEVAHRSGTAALAQGQVDDLFNFAIGGGTYASTWVRTGLELDHAITDAVALSASVHLATSGRDPTVALSGGLKGAF
jgi:probable HAF family extracellular repeat protein